jgi:hypothetical protein
MRTAFRPRMQDPGGVPVLVTEQRGLTMIQGDIDPRDNAAPPVRVTTSREILVRDPGGFLIWLKQRVN